MKTTKEELLKTPMYQLGISTRLTKLFSPTPLMTLQDFFDEQKFVTKPYCHFVWRHPHRTILSKQSVSWVQLKNFLFMNGFTHKDFIPLAPYRETSKGKVVDFSVLDYEQILDMPLEKFLGRQRPELTAGYFVNTDKINVYAEEGFCLVRHITVLSTNQIKMTLSPKKGGAEEINRVKMDLFMAQEELKRCGFTEKDSDLIGYDFGLKTRDGYIKELLSLNTPPEMAEMAVELALKAGWIKVGVLS